MTITHFQPKLKLMYFTLVGQCTCGNSTSYQLTVAYLHVLYVYGSHICSLAKDVRQVAGVPWQPVQDH